MTQTSRKAVSLDLAEKDLADGDRSVEDQADIELIDAHLADFELPGADLAEANPEDAVPAEMEPVDLELPAAELTAPSPDEQTSTRSEPALVALASRLDLKAVGPLKSEILAHRGTDLTLDAARVEHLGALGLQLIRAAARTWAEDDQVLSLTDASNDLADQMILLGFTPETLTRWEPK